MFRFILTKKLFSGQNQAAGANVREAQRPNRRISERFAFDHRRMTMMSDQDIMVVREVSQAGFSSVVSERTWARMDVGDGYTSRLRIGSEILEFSIRVAWKDEIASEAASEAGSEVGSGRTWLLGFEMLPAALGQESADVAWRRLIRPASLAGSLQKVDSSFMQQFGSEKVWYHGDDGCDLMIWSSPEDSKMIAWRLSFDSHYIEWREGTGLETGQSTDLSSFQGESGTGGENTNANAGGSKLALPGLSKKNQSHVQEKTTLDPRRLRDAIDILSAANVDEAPELMQLLEGELANHGQNRRSDLR